MAAGIIATALLARRRPDLLRRLQEPVFVVQVGAALAGAAATGLLALRAAVPGLHHARMLAAALFVALIAVGATVAQPPELGLALGAFVASGVPCALWTFGIAALPWSVLVIAVRRGAPLAPAGAGALAGAGSLLLGVAVLRLVCSIDGRWHLLGWHFGPALLGVGFSAIVGRLVLHPRRAV